MDSTRPSLARRVARVALAVGVGVILGNPILLYFIQDRLLFHPEPGSESNRRRIGAQYPAVREVTVTAHDGTKLHGWLQQAVGVKRAPLLIYFGGNDEDVSYMPAPRDRVPGWSLAVVAYRGYGFSQGKPGESALFADALAIHDAFAARDDVDPARIAIIGCSLGSGVATYVSSHRPVFAAILVTPYDSVLRIASDKFWFVPVSLILRHRFDSLALAPSIRRPALFLVAGQDEMIPMASSRRLFDAWAGARTWKVIDGEGHNTIDQNPQYWPAIGEFLDRLAIAGDRADRMRPSH